jgi:hypothetical protein
MSSYFLFSARRHSGDCTTATTPTQPDFDPYNLWLFEQYPVTSS